MLNRKGYEIPYSKEEIKELIKEVNSIRPTCGIVQGKENTPHPLGRIMCQSNYCLLMYRYDHDLKQPKAISLYGHPSRIIIKTGLYELPPRGETKQHG